MTVAAEWGAVALGDICEAPQYGWTTRARRDADGRAGALRLLRTTDISRGQVDWTAVPFCDIEPPDANKYLLHDGDLVISRAGSIGFSHLIEDPPPSVFASYLIRFRPGEAVVPRYLAWFMKSPRYWLQIGANASGIAQQNINAKKLQTIRVPLPPLEEQWRIVEALETQMTRLEAGNTQILAAVSRLRRYRSQVLIRAIACRDGWSVEPLGDLLVSIRNGLSHKPEGNDGVRILRISAVRAMAIDLDDVRYLDRSKADNRFLIRDGDLLFTRYNGSPDLVGVCGRVEGLRLPTLHPDKIIRAQVDEARALPRYLEIALNTGMAREHIRRLVKTTAGQAGIAGADLKAAPVPLPPYAEQLQVANDVHSQLSVAREVGEPLATAARRTTSLRRAILSAAFTGRLA